MRRRYVGGLLVCIAVALCLSSCSRLSGEPSAAAVRAASIARLREQTEWSEERAEALLELLDSLAYTGEVLFAYPATDDEGEEYYHIWIGEQTVDVYVAEDGSVRGVRSHEIWLYGEAADEDDVPSLPSLQESEEPAAAQQPQELQEELSPSEETQQPEQPLAATLSAVILTDTVAQGDRASLEAYGRAGEQYRIEVHYKSGISEAEGLEVQVAAADGRLFWTWTVSARTTPGDYDIRIVRVADERDAVEMTFTVVERGNDCHLAMGS